jgi:hypothetical protein
LDSHHTTRHTLPAKGLCACACACACVYSSETKRPITLVSGSRRSECQRSKHRPGPDQAAIWLGRPPREFRRDVSVLARSAPVLIPHRYHTCSMPLSAPHLGHAQYHASSELGWPVRLPRSARWLGLHLECSFGHPSQSRPDRAIAMRSTNAPMDRRIPMRCTKTTRPDPLCCRAAVPPY